MITGRCFFGKRYGTTQIAAVVCLTLGLITFSSGNLSSTSSQSSLHPLGVLCISGALVADALIGQVQQRVMNQYQAPVTELMFYSKLIGSAYLLLICLVLGQLFPGIAYCLQYPQAPFYIAIFASVGCVGEFFVMEMVKCYGPLIAVTTTSLRKMFSICLSYVLFPKPVHISHVFGVLLVSIGIFLEVYSKNREEIITLVRRHFPHFIDPPRHCDGNPGEQQVLLKKMEQVA
jgi:solute carrier family 35 (adenosine 3'-phospho 5'-phosphosulfate transporter), member B3